MQKTLITLAVFGAISGAAQAQSSVTIYGIVDTGVAYTNKVNTTPALLGGRTGSKFSVNSGIVQGSRFGFKGVEDLGGGLRALFQLEGGFANDTGALQGDKGSTNLFRRKSVVGLSSNDFGTVLLGRQTDILDDIGGTLTSVIDFGQLVAAVGHGLDRLEGIRTNNAVRYNSPVLAGFTASAIYGFGEAAGQTSTGQTFGFGGIYTNGPLSLFAAYYQSKLGNPTAAPSDTSLINSAPIFIGHPGDTALKTFSLGVNYQAGSARLYGNWSRAKQPLATVSANNIIGGLSNDKADIFELGVNYAVTAPLHIVASIQHTKLDFISTSKGTLNQFNVGADYFLSKRTDLYVFLSDLRATGTNNPGVLGDSTGAQGNQAAIAVGIRHKF